MATDVTIVSTGVSPDGIRNFGSRNAEFAITSMSQAKTNRPRPWYQFSLRYLLFFTLAVASWLGCEVRQAQLTKGHRKAIESLGGKVETEPRGWNLLRYLVTDDFGQHVVAAEIPGQSVGPAIDALADMPHLRRVRVVYDGTCDVHPDWDRLNEELPDKSIEAVEDFSQHEQKWPELFGASGDLAGRAADDQRLLSRFSEKLEHGAPSAQWLFSDLATPPGRFLGSYDKSYHFKQLADGTLIELLLAKPMTNPIAGTDFAFGVLMVGDRAVDTVVLSGSKRDGRLDVQLIDIGGDRGLGVEFSVIRDHASGFDQEVLGLYSITRDGFKSFPDVKPSP
jgi:hypothetical protein